MVKKHKTAVKRLQENQAVELKQTRIVDAVLLRHEQETAASDLSNVLNNDASPSAHMHEHAATALKDSQVEAAAALKISQAADAKLLKKSQQSHAQELKEKNQVISWVMGAYSVDTSKDD
jgi:hypothetical protein